MMTAYGVFEKTLSLKSIAGKCDIEYIAVHCQDQKRNLCRMQKCADTDELEFRKIESYS